MATGNGGAVASFWASLGVKTNKSDLLKVDKFLKDIEGKFKKSKGISLNISKFSIDQKALTRALGNALDMASKSVVFEVSKFVVNDRNLQASLIRASRRLPATEGGSGRKTRSESLVHPGKSTMAITPGKAAIAGATGFGVSRLYAPALALAAGGYGLSRLNKLNQKVVAGELQSQAVVTQAGGTQQQGTDSFNWLKYQANRIGFNYLDAVPSYNNTLAGLTHAGMSVKQGQNIFKGFSEQGRALKLDAVHQKRLFYAISEVADMNQLQKRQLNMINLALPGANSIFAQAYQTQTGGKLTGQAAEAELLKAITARKVNAGILTPAADIASARATGNKSVWDNATHASVAEQSRYQNSIAGLATVASNNGVEEGFSRIFRTLNDGLEHAGPLVARLAQGFNQATKDFRVLALIPDDIMRLLQGKDSFIEKLIGTDKANEVRKITGDLTTFGTNFSTLTDNIGKGWTLIFEQMNKSNDLSITKIIAKQLGVANNTVGAVNSVIGGDYSGAFDQAKQAGKGYIQTLTAPGRGVLDFLGSKLGAGDDSVTNLLGLGGTPTVASSMLNAPPSGTTGTTSITVGDILVQSNATDPMEVAKAVDTQFQTNLANVFQDTGLAWPKAGR